RFEDGAETFRKALELSPNDPALWLWLANACREIPGRAAEAIECLRRCVALDAGFAEAHYELAVILQGEGKVDHAIDCYRAAIGIEPDSAAAHNALGCALLEAGRFAEADESLRTAIELEPENADAYHNRGNVQRMRGARDEALRCFEAALRLRPGDSTIQEAVLGEKQQLCDWEHFEELS